MIIYLKFSLVNIYQQKNKSTAEKSTVQFKDSVIKSVFSSEKVVNRHFKNIGKRNKLNICHETNLTFKL